MTSKPHFDSLLGGTTEVPLEVDVYKFASARAQEIASLSEVLDDNKKGNLIFQRLPRHMRRRVMGHNPKRLPRSLREAYTQQLLKSSGGTLTKQKAPSRKYRRRPTHLLDEYNRRQRSHIWLETHIWHAKRFHMTKRWGYCLPLFPCDRSYRACYRAAANHCLMQDISFFCCIELEGPMHILLDGLSKHTSSCAGLTFEAQSLQDGSREGEVTLYEKEQYPLKCIGSVMFSWKPSMDLHSTAIRKLWIWAHPAFYLRVVRVFSETFQLSASHSSEAMEFVEDAAVDQAPCSPPKKKNDKDSEDKKVEERKLATRNIPFERTPKFHSLSGTVQMILLKDTLNRFRLLGPLSQAVLQEVLQPVSNIDKKLSASIHEESMVSFGDSFHDVNGKGRESHSGYWLSTKEVVSPAELPPRMILSLNVQDPRLQIPEKRTKAETTKCGPRKNVAPLSTPLSYASPLWDSETRDIVTKSKLPTAEINAHRSKLLVPGALRTSKATVKSEDEMLKSNLGLPVNVEIPLILIQKPGSKDPLTKRLGFGCGWDVILPAGWAMPFWLAFIFRCARPSGLREASAHDLECGKCEYLPPDSDAGEEEASRKGKEAREKYFRLPPQKRPNFIKLGIANPFQPDWTCLIRDWIASVEVDSLHMGESSLSNDTSYFVLRDIKMLKELSKFLAEAWSILMGKNTVFNKETTLEGVMSKFPSYSRKENSLLPVRVDALHKGVTDDMSLICLPSPEDLNVTDGGFGDSDLVEIPRPDKNHEERQRQRTSHKRLLLRLRRQRVRSNRLEQEKSDRKSVCKNPKTIPTQDLVKTHKSKMEKLWLVNTNSVGSVKNSCSRETAGFVCKGDFSFTEAKGCGTGYITYLSLKKLVQFWIQQFLEKKLPTIRNGGIIVLIRSPTSFQYRLAKLNLIVG